MILEEIKIYDFDFNLIASEFKCVSFNWDIRYNSIGTFEGVFTLDTDLYDVISGKDFLVCVHGENQGIITSVRIENDKIIIGGSTVNLILEKRICLPFSTKDDGILKSAPELAQALVKKCCGDFMEVLPYPEGFEKMHFTRIEAKPLSEVVSDLLSGVSLGHKVKFDIHNKKWVFSFLLPSEKSIVLSEPDKTLSDSDYVRYLTDFAAAGVYRQKAFFMGPWNPKTNIPNLFDLEKNNFAKVYRVEEDGEMFGIGFKAGDYILCKTEDGKWQKSDTYGHFWHKVMPKGKSGAYLWEKALSCDDISEATEMTLLNDISENVVAIAQGIVKNEFKIGDIVTVQFGKGKTFKVFKKQVKRIFYNFEHQNCFVRPTFYKLKEREDE